MSIKKLLTTLALLAIAISALFYLSRDKADAIATYVKPISDPIYTLDPSQSRYRVDYMIGRAIYGQMLKSSSSGEILPAFVKSWTVNNDGKEFILHLRNDVKFHSGRLATADDLVFTINYLANPNSLVRQFFKDIEGYPELLSGSSKSLKGVSKLNKDTVKINLTKTSYVFLISLSDPKVVMLPLNLNNLSKEAFFSKPDGMGPYSVDFFKNDGRELRLRANTNFYGTRPRIKNYRFVSMTTSEAIAAFINGEVADLELFPVPASTYEKLDVVGQQFTVASYSTSMLLFNSKNSYLANNTNRKKVQNLINVENFNSSCPAQVIKSTGFIPAGAPGWIDPKTITPFPTPKESSKIKAKPVFKLVSYGTSVDRCNIDAVIGQLKKSPDFAIEHLHTDNSKAGALLESGEYDFWIDDLYVRSTDPFNLMTFLDPRSSHYLLSFQDNNIPQLTDKIEATPSLQARAALYRKLNNYISHEKNYIVPLFTQVQRYYFNKNVKAATVPATISFDIGFEETWRQQ